MSKPSAWTMSMGDGRTQGVLDSMTVDIRDNKDAKAATLTPVGIERGGPLDGRHALPFPYDDPQTIQTALRTALSLMAQVHGSLDSVERGLVEFGELRAELDHVGKGIIALAALYGLSEGDVTVPPGQGVPRAAEQTRIAEQVIERAADEKFADRLARLSDEAQTAVFKPEVDAPAADAWVCPDHGTANVVTRKAGRSGRIYRACAVAACNQFEKEVH